MSAPSGTMFSGHGTTFTCFGSMRVPSGIGSAATSDVGGALRRLARVSISLRSALQLAIDQGSAERPDHDRQDQQRSRVFS